MGKEKKRYDGIADGDPIFSPDSNRVAYTAEVDNKWFVVVDGIEEKRYESIGESTPVFSPDSKKLVYIASADNKKFLVVSGKEEEQNGIIITRMGGRIVFDSPESFHYLVIVEDGRIYLVDHRFSNAFNSS